MLNVQPTQGDTKWFTHDRFGLFIHWGLYALAARHEWVKSHERIDTETYQKYFKHFEVTTKHHEGFCRWDTALTDYKAPNTPAGRDLLAPMVEAFRARDMRV